MTKTLIRHENKIMLTFIPALLVPVPVRTTRSTWRGFYSQGITPDRQGDAPRDVREEYCYYLGNDFPVLCCCDNHWEVHAVATSIYLQWDHTFNKKMHQTIGGKPARKQIKSAIKDIEDP
jgi:hypothetical protein